MKKINSEQTQRFAKLAKIRNRKRVYRKKLLRDRSAGTQRSEVDHRTLNVNAPAIFSLTHNYDETVSCLNDLKNAALKNKDIKQDHRRTYLNLDKIENIQPAAAIVLAAELDRWRRVLGIRLRPRNLKKWNKTVLSYLNELGLFELLELDRRYLRRILKTIPKPQNNNVALKFVTDCRNDKQRTDALADQILEVLPEFKLELTQKEDMALGTALAEASLNSVQHAYSHGNTEFPIADKRWWAAASYINNGKTVKFFVYDQGVGIPTTLPKTGFGKSLLSYLGASVGSEIPQFMPPSQMIAHVLNNPLSKTRLEYRGRGFPQIVAATSRAGSTFRVISGHGSANYTEADGATAIKDHKQHLGGTLLEWTFELEEMRK